MSTGQRSGSREPVQRRLHAVDILDAVADCIVVIDDEGTVVDVNPAAQRMLGVTADDAVGRTLASAMPGLEALLPAERALEKALVAGGVDAKVKPRTGGVVPVHVAIGKVPQSTQNGAPQYVLAIRDFRAVRRAQRRLLETERLAAISETVNSLVHDSSNALQRMQSCLTLLRLSSDGDLLELIDDMENAQDQLQQLYEEVRTFVAPLDLERRGADVSKLLDTIWRQLQAQWEAKGLMRSQQVEGSVDPLLNVDSVRLAQVFKYVFENAIRASKDGGEIVSRIEEVDEPDPGIAITIEDSAPGMAAWSGSRPYDFPSQSGTGMGLAIARRIVREHGGEFKLGTDRGTRVRIVLPRCETAEPT